MTPFELTTLLPMTPELIVLGTALVLLMIGAFTSDRNFRLLTWMGILSLAVAGATIVETFDHATFRLFDGLFISNPMVAGFKLIIMSAAGIGLLLSLINTTASRFEYPVLVLLTVVGMMLMVSAGNFMTFYMGLEIQSLALYVLVSFDRDNTKSTEAGLKYFVLGALSSGFLLFGMSMIYGSVGALDYQTVFLSLEKMAGSQVNIGLMFGLVLLLAGLAFKLSAVPFHMWTPDVYEGAPLQVTALMALGPFKIAALGVLIMVLFLPFGLLIDSWQQVIIVMAIASMAVGAIAALRQDNIKRLLGYSSIAHVGYLLTAIVAHSGDSVRAILFYLMTYVLMNAGAFAVLLMIKRRGQSIDEIDGLAGLAKSQPFAAFTLAAMMFSMAGIPPLVGFWGKFYVFMAVIKAGYLWLAIIGVLASLVAAYYYLRVVKVMYFDSAKGGISATSSSVGYSVMGLAAILNLVLFFDPNVLTLLSQRIVGGLF